MTGASWLYTRRSGRGSAAGDDAPEVLFCDNDTNGRRLFGVESPGFFKDAFHEYVVRGQKEAVNPARTGTKAALHYRPTVPAGGSVSVRVRLSNRMGPMDFDGILARRKREADEFYAELQAGLPDPDARHVQRQALAGMIWGKQYYDYDVWEWLDGDPGQPPPPPEHLRGRNRDWEHLHNGDILSMPDKWEYPWYAAWDLAFHMLPFALIDPEFAKGQLVLITREWYMHPNGQLPAYEWDFGDVNPPVHAWAAWRVYKMTGPRGGRDRLFLERVFQKMLINFTWWVNRKDVRGRHLFAGGFLGLDNIGVFDRSRPLPNGGRLEQADGTAWVAFFCGTLLSMALELANQNPAYEDVASKFFEHFVAIADAINTLGGSGLWDEQDGFYYDRVHINGQVIPLRIRSMVGIIPLFAAEVLEDNHIAHLPGFRKRMDWFLKYRQDLAGLIAYMEQDGAGGKAHGHRLLALPSRERLVRVLRYVLDENEFLSPYGVRSLSRYHHEHPFVCRVGGGEQRVAYDPADSTSGMFGGNSNWRGPVWMPVNFLLIEALQRYHHFYGDGLTVECPTGSGRRMTLAEVAREIATRVGRLFQPGADGRRPYHGADARFAADPHWRDLVQFYEYFDGDTGRGLGASHQTGWTALAARLLEKYAGHGPGLSGSP